MDVKMCDFGSNKVWENVISGDIIIFIDCNDNTPYMVGSNIHGSLSHRINIK